MQHKRIMLSRPHLGGGEMKYVEEAFADDWVVPLGPAVDRFESMLADFLGAESVVALSAGTAAIHLGLLMAGVKTGDEVICQSFTFSASANPVVYLGAKPIFVDSEPSTWNMSPQLMREAIVDRIAKTGRKPAAIVVVHLYGMPAMMDEINAIATEFDIPVVEDAAEALGSTYKGRQCATLGKYGALSFNGNKVITTSGGGALVCPDAESADRVKFFATQARENKPYYYHEHIGYNYRLSNISACIGCGQMEVLPEHLARRREIHALYTRQLSDIDAVTVLDNPSTDFDSNFWLTTILIDPTSGVTPEDARQHFATVNIETRRLWRPMSMQPIYADAPFYGDSTAEKLFNRGLCLPSGSSLTDNDISKVVDTMHRLF